MMVILALGVVGEVIILGVVEGMMVEMSAPVVVVPTEPEPVVNIEWFPDRREVTVDFPTPLAPTIETRVSCLLNSAML